MSLRISSVLGSSRQVNDIMEFHNAQQGNGERFGNGNPNNHGGRWSNQQRGGGRGFAGRSHYPHQGEEGQTFHHHHPMGGRGAGRGAGRGDGRGGGNNNDTQENRHQGGRGGGGGRGGQYNGHNNSDHRKAQHKELGMRFEQHPQLGGGADDLSALNVWEPPAELQRKSFRMVDEEQEYFLYFPLELTNKDYHRRVLEIVARGVHDRVLRITAEKQLRAIPAMNENDVYYLLKQVLGNNTDGTGGDAEGQRIRMLFSDELHCPQHKLRDAAQYVFDQRNMLFHLEQDVSTNADTVRLFGAATELLECFGASASTALQRTHDLRQQYAAHQKFRESRLQMLGWDGSDSQAAASGYSGSAQSLQKQSKVAHSLAPHSAAFVSTKVVSTPDSTAATATPAASRAPPPLNTAELLQNSALLVDQLDSALQPQRKAFWQALTALEGFCRAIQRLQRETADKGQYVEAAGLQSLVQQLDAFLEQDFYDHGGGSGRVQMREGSAMVSAAETTIVALRTAEAQAKAAGIYMGANSAEEIKKRSTELLSRKDTLKQLLAAKIPTFPPLFIFGQHPTSGDAARKVALSGRQLWFSVQQNGASVASLVHEAKCLSLVKIACQLQWLDEAFSRYCCGELTSLQLASTVRGRGYQPQDLVQVGVSASDMRQAGYAVGEVAAAGFSASILKAAGFGAFDFKNAGSSAHDLATIGFSISELRKAGCVAEELKAIGYGISELKVAGYRPIDLKELFWVKDLKAARYSASEVRNAGFDARQLKDGGFSYCELKSAGYRLSDLNELFSVSELRAAGCSASEMRNAGFDARQLLYGGFSYCELKAAGYRLSDLKKLLQFSVSDVSELKAGGYSASEARDAGFFVQELKDGGFSYCELKAAGYRPSDLKKVFSAGELKAAGYSASEVRNAGFNAGQLKNCGYSCSELIAAGYCFSDLKSVFRASQLKAAGFSVSEFEK